jgi:two-component system alkaline phosphatase synthesis response regulator PhoP
MENSEKILIIEDDPSILLGLEKNLKYEGFKVLVARDGEVGLEMAVDEKPDLVVLDLMLPSVNGFEICRILRKCNPEIPILILTAKSQEEDKVRGLELGADDFITKPFSIREFIARIKSAFRRMRLRNQELENYTFADCELSITGQSLTRQGVPVELSHTEFKLLKYLIENEGRVLDRSSILNKVWGYDYYGTARTIDNFINKLRQKVEKDLENPRHILTVRGTGYKFLNI